MPRVNSVMHARKAGLTCGKCECEIKVGEPYVWWQFKNQGKSIRCGKIECKPQPSELTQSEFWSTILGLQETAFKIVDDTTVEDLAGERDDVQSQLEELADELESKRDNMPEWLQDSATGELLTERADAVGEAADTLSGVDVTLDDDDDDDDDDDEEDEAKEEKKQEKLQEIADELQEALSSISCS